MKRVLTILSVTAFLLAVSSTAFGQRPKVGVVLCGGGAKGAAHVGVLKVLEENEIPIDYIAGTSMGAIIGGLYAIGYKADDIDSLLCNQDWDMVMNDRISRTDASFEQKQIADRYIVKIPFGKEDYSRLSAPKKEEIKLLNNIPLAYVTGHNVYNLFTKLSVGYQDSLDFNKMPIPFACVAVDLISRKEVVFRSGNFVEAIRASMAIPGYFAPVKMGDMVLVDGGALNNYPVDVVKEMGADIIIGVKLGEEEKEEPVVENIGDMVNRFLDLYMDAKLKDELDNTDILIAPSVKGYNALSFDTESLRTLMHNGWIAAKIKEPQIRRVKSAIDQAEKEAAASGREYKDERSEVYSKAIRLDRDTITIGAVSWNGLDMEDARLLVLKSIFKSGARLTGRMIDEEISRLYNTLAFESITYSLKGHDPYDMELNFVKSRSSVLGMGFRFDNEEIASVYLRMGFNDRALYGSKYSISAKLAYNMQFSANYSYASRSLAQCNLSYDYRGSSLNIGKKELSNPLSFDSHSLSLDFSTRKLRSIHLNMGLSADYFNYHSLADEATAFLDDYNTHLDQNIFLSAFLKYQMDKLDNAYFPTKGFSLSAEGRWFDQKLMGRDDDFKVVSFNYRQVIPIVRRFALIGSVENRTILGSNPPVAYMNTMGGTLRSRYMNQQIPFVGFNFSKVFDKFLSTASLEARANVFDSHYIYATAAYAVTCDAVENILNHQTDMLGFRLGYSYSSVLGPVSFGIGWSDYTGKVCANLSIGFNF